MERLIKARTIDTYLAILGPRQIGKTSLLHRAQATIKDGWRIVFIDFQSIPRASQAECYTYLYDNIFDQIKDTLKFWAKLKKRSCIETHPQLCDNLQQLALDSNAHKIVVLIDEMGALNQEVAISLCQTIRFIFSNRHRPGNEGFAQYLFVFAGAFDLYRLSRGESQKVSPLSNIVDLIYINDLDKMETREFLERNFRRMNISIDENGIDYVYEVTQGHPYLLHTIGSLIENMQQLQPSRITANQIEEMIEEILANDHNLRHLVESLLLEENANDLVEVYEIIRGKKVGFSRTNPQVTRLELMGLVKNGGQGVCVCKNTVYSRMILENTAIAKKLFAAQDHSKYFKLQELLSNIKPRFAKMHASAWEMLQAGDPEKARLATHEMRELLVHVLDDLAPVGRIQSKRKQQIRSLLQGSNTRVEVIESLAKLGDTLYQALTSRSHLRDYVKVKEAISYTLITEDVLLHVLEANLKC